MSLILNLKEILLNLFNDFDFAVLPPITAPIPPASAPPTTALDIALLC